MEYQTYLELSSLSASDLKRGWLSGYQTEAIAWIDSSLKKSTGMTSGGGCNVQWQEKMMFPLVQTDVMAQQGKWLTIEIRSQSPLGVNHVIGTANVPLAELAADFQKEPNRIQTYQLVLPSGKRYGSVSFLGKIVGVMSSDSPATSPSAPPMSLLRSFDTWAHSSVLDQPLSEFFVEANKEKPSNMNSMYPTVCFPQKLTSDGTYLDQSSPFRSSGMATNPNLTSWGSASPPIEYPTVCQPPNKPNGRMSTPCCKGMIPYPPLSSTPELSCVSTGRHVMAHDLCPPPTFIHAYTAPNDWESSYAPPSVYPCPAHMSPRYPTLYAPPPYEYHVPHHAY